MKLIVGLGNPGSEYENTRHNCGFRVIDAFADVAHFKVNKEDFKGVYGKEIVNGDTVILFKPYTFMNLSGEAVIQIVKYFKINIDDIIVIYDDMAISPGDIRLRFDGSSGGHKGMQSIIDFLGTESIKRIRVGIGEPSIGAIDFVLGKPHGEEAEKIDDAINRASVAIKEYLLHGFQAAMSKCNGGGNR